MTNYVVCATMGEDCVALGRLSQTGPFEPVPTSLAHPHATLAEAERTARTCPLPTLIVEFSLSEQRCSDPPPLGGGTVADDGFAVDEQR